MGTLHIFTQSVYAGFMIGIGGIVYLSADNRVVGSLLFSFGLLTIVTQGFFLYTGKVGFVRNVSGLLEMPVIIAGNFTGTFAASFMARFAGLGIDSSGLVGAKLENDLERVFVLSVFCGVMMYLAIDNYQKNKNIAFIIAPVMIFILSGFEHSIANMFYFHFAGEYSLRAFACLLVMLAGNGIGAWIFGRCKEKLF